MDRLTYARLSITLGTALVLGACPGDDTSAQDGTTTDAASSSSSAGPMTSAGPTTTVADTTSSTDTSTGTTTGTETSSGTETTTGTETTSTETTTGTETTSTETTTSAESSDSSTTLASAEGSSSSTTAASSSSTGASACDVQDLGLALPATVLVDTTDAGDDFESCAGPDGVDDIAVRWTAPAAGTYMFTTSRPGTVVTDTVVSVLDGDCDGPVLDCDDDINGLTFRSLASVTLAADQSVIVVLDGFSGNSVGPMELYIDALPASQPGGSCCAGDSGVGGCDTPDVEACVCSFRPECCDGEWDAQCVSGAATECLAICGCVEFAGCDAPSDDCVCQGCNIDGVCDENDDCIDCIDCVGEPACGCNSDGLCEPFNENCACADCADEVVCTG